MAAVLLRTRVGLIVGAVVAVLAGGLLLAGMARERVNEERYAGAVAGGDAALWRATLEAVQHDLDRGATRLVALGEALGEAVEALSPERVADVLALVTDPVLADAHATRLEVNGADGTLLYTTQHTAFPTPILDARQVGTVVAGERLRGLARDDSHQLLIAVALPVRVGGRAVGVAVIGRDVDGALRSFQEETGGEVFILSRRGRVLAGTAPALDRVVGTLVASGERAPLRTVTVTGRAFAMLTVSLPHTGSVGADLVVLREITASERDRRRIMIASLATAAAVAVAAVVLLGWTMRQAFRPMEAGISVLNALSRGDTRLTIEGATRDDEIGRIARAVGVLRREIIALDRLKRSRERQRLRQERFIRRRMVDLAGTLDDEARVEVLRDLEEIEAVARIPAGDPAGPADSLRSAFGGGGLGMIAPAIDRMSARVQEQHARLKEVIDALQEALAVKTAFISLQHELGIARSMQLAILPKALPEAEAFEVYGTMTPAKEVGGDFYDFFPIDADRLAVVVADVSGKGIPAAFFMAVSRTLLKATALFGEPPGACLAKLNDLLCENNEQELFVTVFYGIFHPADGRLVYANGGHNPPYLLRGERVERLAMTGGMALAMIDGLEYNEATVVLDPGDGLFLYTDGVTEAFDPDAVEFSEARLVEVLAGLAGAPARDIPHAVIDAVETFARGAAQSDDITCVALRRRDAHGQGGESAAP